MFYWIDTVTFFKYMLSLYLNSLFPLGMMAHAYIPALWEVEAGESNKVRSWRPACPTWGNPISTKNTKN